MSILLASLIVVSNPYNMFFKKKVPSFTNFFFFAALGLIIVFQPQFPANSLINPILSFTWSKFHFFGINVLESTIFLPSLIPFEFKINLFFQRLLPVSLKGLNHG